MKKLLFIASIPLVMLSSCMIGGVRGSGHVITKQFNETGFKNIDVGSVMKVYLKQGDQYEVKVEAEDNLLDLMEVKTSGDKLKIGFKDNTSVNPTKDIVVYITAPDFHNLEAGGAGGFVSQGTIKTSELNVDVSGACKVKLDVDVNALKVEGSGSSDIILAGNTNSLEVDGSGSIDVKAFDLKSQHTTVGISGSGKANVVAEQTLKVDVSGSGDVNYKGHPTITQDISGSGNIKAVN